MCISYLHLQYVLIYKNIYIDIYQIWLGNRFINYNKQYKIFRGSSTKYWDPNVIVRMSRMSDFHVKLIVQTKPYVVETWNLEGW